MISGFDEAVVWMKVWEKKSIVLPPEKAYWKYDETKKQVVPRSDLKSFEEARIKLEKWVKLPTQFWNLEILEADDKNITIDLNWEMAGKTLKFDIEIVSKN